MARTISWQSRLSDMHRRVNESPRSPYHRQDIERLFDVQTPTAKKLIALMGRTAIGNSLVVEREHLLEFLAQAIDAEDLPAYLEQLRKDPPRVSRRKVRMAIPREFQEGNLQTLSRSQVWLERGRLEITFTTLDDLTSKLHQLMHVLPDPAFERRYCERPVEAPPTAEELLQAQDMKRIQAETKAIHKVESTREAIRRRDAFLAEDITESAEMLQQVVDALSAEAHRAIDELTEESENVAAMLRAKLADLLSPSELELPSAPSPGSSFPHAAEPYPSSEREGRSSSW